MSILLDHSGKPVQPLASLRKVQGRKNPNPIIARIASRFADQSRKDIDKWRKASTLALHPQNPRRDLLMDLYHDLMTDGHLMSQLSLRKSATLNTNFHVLSAGEMDEEKTRLFSSRWFYDLLEHLLDTLFYGHTLLELSSFSSEGLTIDLIPRAHVVPQTRQIITDLSRADQRFSYDQVGYAPYLLEAGKKESLGLLHAIVPNLIWKRNIMQSWAEFCERFGIPMVTATTLRQTDEALENVESMLQQLGEAAYAVFPEGTHIDFKEANRTDAYQVFNAKIERNNEEVSKALLGGTMLSDNGSSRSQSEVHERNLEKRLAIADRRHITFIVNDQLIPLLIQNGYPLTKEDVFTFNVAQEIEITEHWNMVRDMLSAGYEVDEKWMSTTFNVPLTGKKEPSPLSSVSATLAHTPPALLAQIKNVNFPAYGQDCCKEHDLFTPSATYSSEMADLHDELFEKYWNRKDTLSQEAQITVKESLRLLSALREGWAARAIEAAWNEPDHLMLSLMEYNLFEFASSKTEARLASLSQLLIDKEKLSIRSFEDFKREATKITDPFNTTWLRTEYNLSVAVGQNSAAFNRALSEQDVIPYVQYQTVGDRNVRSSHELLNNRIFALKDATARNLWPPNGYGCRCEMVQYPYAVPKEKVSSGKSSIHLLGEGFKTSPFNINRGDIRQVFTKKQFYHSIKGLDEKINSMDFKSTYGLTDYSSIKKTKKPIRLDASITPENVAELFRVSGKQKGRAFMGFEDYLKRKIILKKEVFDTHTKGKYTSKSEMRHQLFPHLPDILNNPDEVWLHEYEKEKFQSRYIKFYGDRAVIVDANLGNKNLEIATWYNLKAKEKQIRKGLLIKKREG